MTGHDGLRQAAPYLAALAVAGGLFYLTLGFPAPRPGTLGPAFWPRVAIALMAVVSLVEIVRLLLGSAARPERSNGEDEDVEPIRPMMLLGGLVLLGAYAASITTLGYVFASFLFLVSFMYIGGYRNHLVLWTSAALGMIAIAVIFLKVVYVSLPRGVPPFSGWVDTLLRLIGIN